MDRSLPTQIKTYDRLVNPVSVSFSIAFFALSFATFLAYEMNGNAFWYRVGYFTNVIGVFAAAAGSLPWVLDWTSGIPKGTHVRRHSSRQGIFGITAFVLFALNWIGIRGTFDLVPLAATGPLFLTGVGLVCSIIAGYHAFVVMAENRGAEFIAARPRLESRQDYEITEKKAG